jgi:hypothetical protein
MNDTIHWLLANGGPSIRCRTLTELCDDAPPREIREAALAVETSPMVQKMLAEFFWTRYHMSLHGSATFDLENLLGRLSMLGYRAGRRHLDAQVEVFLEALALRATVGAYWHPMHTMLMGGMLALAGYTHEPAVRAGLRSRLETLYAFVRQGRFDIYVDAIRFRNVPANLTRVPLIDPALYADGELVLPTIYDLYGLGSYPVDRLDQTTLTKIEAVVSYVLDPRYQALRNGFGLILTRQNRFYLAGSSAHLAGYAEERPDRQPARMLRHLLMMSCFQAARWHPWFILGMAHLESFRTEEGHYLFPRPYLTQNLSGYWVHGAYMALENKPRNTHALERESTFTMARLQRERAVLAPAIWPPPLTQWSRMRELRSFGHSNEPKTSQT